MSEFRPVTTLEDLAVQNVDDVVAGYWSGYHGHPEPLASVYSRAFWHGWWNGAVDGGHRVKSDAQAELAKAYAAARLAS